MFAKGRPSVAQMRRSWHRLVDVYLVTSDRFFDVAGTARKNSIRFATRSSLVQPGSRSIIKFTMLGLLIALSCVLFSCEALFDQQNNVTTSSQRPSPSLATPTKKNERLYIKRDTLQIRPSEPGSSTGSIWADAKQARQLFAEPKPSRLGESIVIEVPEDLQFKWQPTFAKKDAKQPDKSKEAAANKGEASSDTKKNDALDNPLSDPSQNYYEPLKNFKMQIVAMEPGGFTYLHGTRYFKDGMQHGDERTVSVYAKVPTDALQSYTIDAHTLSEIAISDSRNGVASDYSAPGWDMVVSRKVSGFTPDLNAEYAALEDVRNELKSTQDALRERQKGIDAEADRLRKDRERFIRAQEEAKARENKDAPENADGVQKK